MQNFCARSLEQIALCTEHHWLVPQFNFISFAPTPFWYSDVRQLKNSKARTYHIDFHTKLTQLIHKSSIISVVNPERAISYRAEVGVSESGQRLIDSVSRVEKFVGLSAGGPHLVSESSTFEINYRSIQTLCLRRENSIKVLIN